MTTRQLINGYFNICRKCIGFQFFAKYLTIRTCSTYLTKVKSKPFANNVDFSTNSLSYSMNEHDLPASTRALPNEDGNMEPNFEEINIADTYQVDEIYQDSFDCSPKDETQSVKLLKEALVDKELMKLVLEDRKLMEMVASDEKIQRWMQKNVEQPRVVRHAHVPHVLPVHQAFLSVNEIIDSLNQNFGLDVFHLAVAESAIPVEYVDHLLVVTGRSTRHLKAMAHALKLKFKKAVAAKGGNVTAVIEGETCNDWMVIDVGNAIVHFMLEETRAYYELESLWRLGPELDPQYQAMLEDDQWRLEPLPMDSPLPVEDDEPKPPSIKHITAKIRGGTTSYKTPKIPLDENS